MPVASSRRALISLVLSMCHWQRFTAADWPDNYSKLFPEAADAIYPVFRATITTLPEQIHLSLGDNVTSMAVMWATLDEFDERPSYVYYGKGSELNMRAVAAAELLGYGNSDGSLGQFRAVMTDLTPGMVYSYQVQTAHHKSKVFTFRHLSDVINRPSSFVIYGDLGKIGDGYTIKRLKEEANSGQHDLFIHVGDFAYDLHSDNGRRGDGFMRHIEPMASQIPYMTTPGNHEIPFDFSQYRWRFSAPNTPWPIPKYKMWYGFDIGLVHFISYSTEVYYTDGEAYAGEQYKWLKEDLEKANRNRGTRPWIIVFGHRPMYCSNSNRDDCTKALSRLRREPYNLEQLFHEAGVDLILEAHEHSYERLYPLYNGTQTDCGYTDPHAPVHIIAGSAGCNERQLLCADTFLFDPLPSTAYRSWLPGLNGYGKLRAENATHLYWEQIMSITDDPMDGFYIIQHNHTVRDSNVRPANCSNPTWN